MGAVETGALIAREHDSAVVVVHALRDDSVHRHDYDFARDAATALLDDASQQLAEPGRTVESQLLCGGGPVAARLAAAAQRWDADLVVLGSRRLTDLGGLLLGSVAHELVRRTPRPVLLAERSRR